ncbi:MAG: indolepyruvate ferredoxin oxidoreductase family protein [Candidatus Methylomirabilia bacterium]
MQLATVSLDDKYSSTQGRIHITGSQALARLAMMQFMRDKAAGRHTACYISGYRGSPMHNIDKELWRAGKFLQDSHIHFWPAVNEDLAATAIWGTQQANAFGDARYDGVFAMWYGKGPGIDRSMDAIRHGHMAGSSRHGGVLVVVGDDHALTSTDAPAAHELAFAELMMPVLYPATVQDIVDYGLYGWAMSRFCGAWVGFKIIPDTVDTSATLEADPWRPEIVLPEDVELPPDGLNIRVPDLWFEQEPRLRQYKLPAALAFARANRLNRVIIESRRPRFGIIAAGKAYNDVRQALFELGIDDQTAANIGIILLKLAMPYPFDAESVRAFTDGLEEVFVVEEKHRMTEMHVRDALYILPDGRRPRVVGRVDEAGNGLLPAWPEITPEHVTRALARRLTHFYDTERLRARLAFLNAKEHQTASHKALSITRLPYFCSGCPHNTSTRVPEGSRALGGVGCHFMATYMDRNNITHTHMGGEGVNWIGQAPFVKTEHVFQNLGDGTYYHSGLLAIRACVAADANITFKILYNDAVGMTGGQPIDGPLTPAKISHQVYAEGVRRIYVVSDDPDKYPRGKHFAPSTIIEHRRALDRIQRECRAYKGVSVLIYDQTCAAEKRRRRKHGRMIDPPRRIFINDRVCEGCGECNATSNCLSVLPLDTAFGRKRQIDQSGCNKDYSCAEGFCPSFVSVYGAEPRKSAAQVQPPAHLVALPEPERPAVVDGRPYSMLVTGVGGTGVVTIGALITMAAHMEGQCFSTVDQFGMAQKGGAVTSHIRLARRADDIRAVRLNAGAADLVLGCDSLVTGTDLALSVMARGHTRVIVNTYQQITGHFTRDADLSFPAAEIETRINTAAGAEQVDYLEATRMATRLLGDSIATNLFMLGYAYQKGLVPVAAAGIERAIELNGVAVEMNQQAFLWGRRAGRDWEAASALAAWGGPPQSRLQTLDELIAHRLEELTAYQDAAYAERYRRLVERVQTAETGKTPGQTGLGDAVARCLYKLMAQKDEYEVARLYTDGRFERLLRERFEGDYALKFHLAPPLFAFKDPETGFRQKRTYGAWMLTAMRVLARLKGLRGTPLDIFGYHPERRLERQLLADYEAVVSELVEGLNAENHDLAVGIASIPEKIRGYGHVKERHIAAAKAEEASLLAAWRQQAAALTRVA